MCLIRAREEETVAYSRQQRGLGCNERRGCQLLKRRREISHAVADDGGGIFGAAAHGGEYCRRCSSRRRKETDAAANGDDGRSRRCCLWPGRSPALLQMAATEDHGAAAHGLTAEEDRRRYCPWRRRKIYGAAGGCGVLVVGKNQNVRRYQRSGVFPYQSIWPVFGFAKICF